MFNIQYVPRSSMCGILNILKTVYVNIHFLSLYIFYLYVHVLQLQKNKK